METIKPSIKVATNQMFKLDAATVGNFAPELQSKLMREMLVVKQAFLLRLMKVMSDPKLVVHLAGFREDLYDGDRYIGQILPVTEKLDDSYTLRFELRYSDPETKRIFMEKLNEHSNHH